MHYKLFKNKLQIDSMHNIWKLKTIRHSIENDDPFILAIVISEYVSGVGLGGNLGFNLSTLS